MSGDPIDIALHRGRLLERISAQRAAIAVELEPISRALHTADRAVAGVQASGEFIKRHPAGSMLAATLTTLAILKPRRTWRLARRSFIAWRAWKAIEHRLHSSGKSFRQT